MGYWHSADLAAKAVGISTKNVITLCQRDILEYKRDPIGETKGTYSLNWSELCFLAVLVRFAKQFSIKYRDTFKWKKDILDAMNQNAPFLIITSAGEAKVVKKKAEPLTMPIDLDRVLEHDAVVLLNILKLRGDLVRKIDELKK